MPIPRKRLAARRLRFQVAELFAGVGGFRIGFEQANVLLRRNAFSVVWSNQWEPATKRQHASEVYASVWGNRGHSNEDIAQAIKEGSVPRHDLLVGGFPCQDYSVARTLNQAAGIAGKKGVLWWQIHKILEQRRPAYGLFENVDRLVKSPAKQRGRDFAVMLASLRQIGYFAEWRIINSADYGFPQRRKRTFILVYRDDSPIARRASAAMKNPHPENWLTDEGIGGILANALPCVIKRPVKKQEQKSPTSRSFELTEELADVSEQFNVGNKLKTPFEAAGFFVDGKAFTAKVEAKHEGPSATLGSVLQNEGEVPAEFFIPPEELEKWRYLKGAKSLKRTKKNGVVYSYDEGPIAFPDSLNKPSRTIVTGEGGSTPSRFKHVVQLPSGRWRRLTPVELERLCGFPDNHTKVSDITDTKRAFFMGNALVTGIVTKIAVSLLQKV